MHLFRVSIWSALAVIGLGFVPQAQAERQAVSGPLLGFARDNTGTAIRPIIGVPGAAVLADRLQFEAEIRGAVISPSQDFALAVRGDNGSVVVINLTGDAPALMPLPLNLTGPAAIGISPTGSSAAVYDPVTQTVQVIGHLPQAADVIRQFDLSSIEGGATGIAVSDDGAIVLVSFPDQLWAVNESSFSQLGSGGSGTAAFFPNRHDAIVTDDATQNVFIITNIDQIPTRAPILSAGDGLESFSNVVVSQNGREVFVADNSGKVAIVDMETRQPKLIDCQCRPTGLYHLKQNSAFRLSDESGDPIIVLDNSSGDARTFVIPPVRP